MSPEKFVIWLVATKLKTVMEPFGPLKRLNVCPPIFGTAIGVEPVVEIGPAPPRAESQIITSNWALPPAEEEVNMS